MQIINEIGLNSVHGDLFGGDSAAVIALPVAPLLDVVSGICAETALLTRPAAWQGIG